MIISIIFFAVAYLVGTVILTVFRVHLAQFRHVLALILGSAFLTLSIFILGFMFKLTVFTAFSVLFLYLSLSLLYFLKYPGTLKLQEKALLKNNYLEIIPFLFLGVIIFLLFQKSIITTPNSVIAGNRIVWTDWPVHFAIISSFVFGDNFPPQNPLHSGSFLAYPFFSDFLSAILQTLGENLKSSLLMPGFVLGVTSFLLIYNFGKIITSNYKSLLALFIGIFWGGLGFTYFFQDLLNSQNPLSVLLSPPHEYTFYSEKNLWFFSFLYSELLPQRAFLFGLPLFFAAVSFFIFGLVKKRKTYLFLSALITSLLPLFHFHSFLSLTFFLGIFASLSLLSEFFEEGFSNFKKSVYLISVYFALPVIGAALLQFPLFSSVDTSQIIHFNWGWMKNSENFFLFWFKNTGLFIPLFILGAWIFRKDALKRNIAIAASGLFIIPNIISFAPWPYDNLKILTYFYFIGSFFVAHALSEFAKKGIITKFLATSILISLTLSGIVEVWGVVGPKKNQFPLWSERDFEMAETIINNTEPDSVILTAAIHDHPVAGLAGRKQVIGFPGNAWSWGFADWWEREQDVRKMLIAESSSINNLFRKYKISYVLISDRESFFERNTNENYYRQNATFVAGGPNYKLYRVIWQIQ